MITSWKEEERCTHWEEALLDPFSVSSPIFFSTAKKDKVESCQSDMLDYKIPLKQKGRSKMFDRDNWLWLVYSVQCHSLTQSGIHRWLSGKESTCQYRRHRFNLWVGKIPWRRKWQPIPVFLPGKSHGHRSLAGYSPWGPKTAGRNLVTKTIPRQEGGNPRGRMANTPP